MKNSELEEEIRLRQAAIATLEEDVKRLQDGINQMAHELEVKGKEILNVRSEANRTLRFAHKYRSNLQIKQVLLFEKNDKNFMFSIVQIFDTE